MADAGAIDGGAPAPGAPPQWLAARLDGPIAEPLCVRPLRAGDAALERRFVAQLSTETLQQRLMGMVSDVTDAQVAELLRQDWPRRLGLALLRCEARLDADEGADDEAEILGVARFDAAEDRPGFAEFAIVVADRWQHKGLGHALLGRLVDAARAAGYRGMVGTTFADNRPMVQLARSYQFEIEPEPGEPGLRRLTRVF